MFKLLEIGIECFVGVILFVFFLKRLLAWMDDRGWITSTGHVPTYGTLGNAFLEFQAIVQPEMTYVLEEKQEEKTEQNDQGGPDKAGTPASD